MKSSIKPGERSPEVAREVERYLSTGDHDSYHAAWHGSSFIEMARNARDDLRQALVTEVRRRSRGHRVSEAIRHLDSVALTRKKTEPMIRGLFPRAEQDTVLSAVERSIVFLTPHNIDRILYESHWHHSAWTIANLYLGSIGAELLGEDAPRIVGMSEETTCFVSPLYFEDQNPFADYVVHEVAHIFHNCKRRTIGLNETRRREWLLDVDFQMRETFAYSCEAFARVVERAPRLRDRQGIALEFSQRVEDDGDDGIYPEEVADIVLEASAPGRRNGWKVILARCAPPRKARRSAANHRRREA